LNSQPAPNKLPTTSLTLGIIGWATYLLQWCFDLTLGLVLATVTGGSSAVCATMLDVLPFAFWLTGIVIGHVALGQIKHTSATGRRRAIWGLLLNYSGLFFTLIFIIAILVLIFTGVGAGWLDKVLPQIHKWPVLSR
jgi:hypothetical protein